MRGGQFAVALGIISGGEELRRVPLLCDDLLPGNDGGSRCAEQDFAQTPPFRQFFTYPESCGIQPRSNEKRRRDSGVGGCHHHWITGLRLARDPGAGSKAERVIDAVEDGIWLANQIYDKALLRFGQGNIDVRW